MSSAPERIASPSDFRRYSLEDNLPKKANLGCGFDYREGWLNVDFYERHNPDLVANIVDLSLLPSGYFSELVAHDVLEHIERGRTIDVLREWARLTEIGGTLEVRVPSLEGLFGMIARPGITTEETEDIIQYLYGTQAYSGDYHLTSFSAKLLNEYLLRAGMLVCEAGLDGHWLWLVKARKTASLTDPRDIIHNSYFRVLQRGPTATEIESLMSKISKGRLNQSQVDALLSQTKEARTLKSQSAFFRELMTTTSPHIVRRAIAKMTRLVAGQDDWRKVLPRIAEIARKGF